MSKTFAVTTTSYQPYGDPHDSFSAHDDSKLRGQNLPTSSSNLVPYFLVDSPLIRRLRANVNNISQSQTTLEHQLSTPRLSQHPGSPQSDQPSIYNLCTIHFYHFL